MRDYLDWRRQYEALNALPRVRRPRPFLRAIVAGFVVGLLISHGRGGSPGGIERDPCDYKATVQECRP